MKLFVTGVAITLLFYTGSWFQASARIGESSQNERRTDETFPGANNGGTGSSMSVTGISGGQPSNMGGTTGNNMGTGMTGNNMGNTMGNNMGTGMTGGQTGDRTGGTGNMGTGMTGSNMGTGMTGSNMGTGMTGMTGNNMGTTTGNNMGTTMGNTMGTGMVGGQAVDRTGGAGNMGGNNCVTTTTVENGITVTNTDCFQSTTTSTTATTAGDRQGLPTIPATTGTMAGKGAILTTTTNADRAGDMMAGKGIGMTVDRTGGTQVIGGVTTGSIPVVPTGTVTTGNTGFTQANQNIVHSTTIDRAGGTTVFASKASKGVKVGFAGDRIGGGKGAVVNVDRSGNTVIFSSKASKAPKNVNVNAVRTGGVVNYGTTTSYTGTTVDRTGGTVTTGSIPHVASVQYSGAHGFTP